MKQSTLAGLVAAIALVLGVYAAIHIAPPDTEQSSTEVVTEYLQYYPQPRALESFELTRQDGTAFTKQDFAGHWSLVFVGYTFCPDICPTTMAQLNQIYPQLAEIEAQHPLQVVFISVDPKRDSIERLAQYIGFFNPAFIAVTGEHKVLYPLVRSMGMMYAIAESTDQPNYLVDHSASIVVVNPQAQVIGRFKPRLEPGQLAVSDSAQIAADMPLLLRQ